MQRLGHRRRLGCGLFGVPRVQTLLASPVRVNQCNGTGNAGGTLLTCSTRITTNVLAMKVSAPTLTTTSAPTTTKTATATTANGTTTAKTATKAPNGATITKTTTTTPSGRTTTTSTTTVPPQVTRVPRGGVATGGGWAARGPSDGLLATGVLLLALAAALAGYGATASRRRR